MDCIFNDFWSLGFIGKTERLFVCLYNLNFRTKDFNFMKISTDNGLFISTDFKSYRFSTLFTLLFMKLYLTLYSVLESIDFDNHKTE